MDRNRNRLKLRLFVAGDSPDSAIAVANLEALFGGAKTSGDVQIEIVDVREEPARAALDGVMVTPTLIKVSPSPGCRILGNLSNRDALTRLLEVKVGAGRGILI